MIEVFNDKELRDLDFHLMLAVHDELIGECPIENSEKVAKRLCDVMKIVAERNVNVPFKCDPTIEDVWYYTDYSDNVNKTYKEYIKKGISKEEAFNKICEKYCECSRETLLTIVE